jgi:hypothetical protein
MVPTSSTAVLDRIADLYLGLVLSVGRHDPDYVDAYYGPEEYRKRAEQENRSLPEIRTSALAAAADLRMGAPAGLDEILILRHRYLLCQLESLIARVDLLGGTHMTFDQESAALYDAVAPTHSEAHFEEVLEQLGAALPGKGEVANRYEAYKREFTIPPEKLDRVFLAAVEESRRRTMEHIELPEGESFTLEYVKNKPWSGYNWYKGGCRSLIQINTDLPISIDRAVDLGSHEGYPGHHLYNSLLETRLVRQRSWREYTVYALFSPQSLIAEGTANFGIVMAFPGEDRIRFERDVLFPLAGLVPAGAGRYYAVHALVQKLAYAGNEAARRYLNGEIGREEAVAWLVRYALMSPERAQQRTRFFDTYRSYVINYNLGQDLVQSYVESRGGLPGDPVRRWDLFEELISTPRVPSMLREQ